ncbi:group II intron reverse transcriptase/maturase [Cytobacillus oceanisediminis]|nr:group II intron reverse transcriptase/maturase [Cytobacillus oceanisediminis]
MEEGKTPYFKDLLEIMTSEITITTAIHNIKSNKGSKTPGVDKIKMDHYLQKGYEEVITEIQESFMLYKPNLVRRKLIKKANSNKKRPLGIPTIKDRIVQECVRLVLEPILEAQFFEHSYGFRPFRDTHQAYARTVSLISTTGYQWVVEGDIKGFFDNIDHRILLKKLWGMGVRDRRVLMIIKQMLKAGVMNEKPINELGTPQGGIISPLLANVYLHTLDKWITREWEKKQTKKTYTENYSRLGSLRKTTNLKPAYFIRYADDWILITNSRENAEKWKYRISQFLKVSLKIELSEDKTLITKLTKKPIKFLGFEIKAHRRRNSEVKVNKKLITTSRPSPQKIKDKVKNIKHLIRKLKSCESKEEVIHQINHINLVIRGIIQYYQQATLVNKELSRYSHYLTRMATRYLKRRVKVEIVKAKQVDNLLSVHKERNQRIPAVRDGDVLIGVTNIGFCKFKIPVYKNQKETPYSIEGRQLYQIRTNRKPLLERADELISLKGSHKTVIRGDFRNFEYYMNRCYAFNRDRGRCKICTKDLSISQVQTHHINPKLPINEVNKVANLATVHEACHKLIHSSNNLTEILDNKVWKKVLFYRRRLAN